MALASEGLSQAMLHWLKVSLQSSFLAYFNPMLREPRSMDVPVARLIFCHTIIICTFSYLLEDTSLKPEGLAYKLKPGHEVDSAAALFVYSLFSFPFCLFCSISRQLHKLLVLATPAAEPHSHVS